MIATPPNSILKQMSAIAVQVNLLEKISTAANRARYVPVPKGDVHKKKEVVQVGSLGSVEAWQGNGGDHPKWRLISGL